MAKEQSGTVALLHAGCNSKSIVSASTRSIIYSCEAQEVEMRDEILRLLGAGDCFPTLSQSVRKDGHPFSCCSARRRSCLRKAKGAPAVRVLRLRYAPLRMTIVNTLSAAEVFQP